jgi:hypothetical protein
MFAFLRTFKTLFMSSQKFSCVRKDCAEKLSLYIQTCPGLEPADSSALASDSAVSFATTQSQFLGFSNLPVGKIAEIWRPVRGEVAS